LLTPAVLAFVLPLVLGQPEHWPLWGWILMAASIPLVGTFVLAERRVAATGGTPLIPGRVLRVPAGPVARRLDRRRLRHVHGDHRRPGLGPALGRNRGSGHLPDRRRHRRRDGGRVQPADDPRADERPGRARRGRDRGRGHGEPAWPARRR